MSGLSPPGLDAHEAEVVRALREAAEEVLDAGLAHIEMEPAEGYRPTLVTLTPTRVGAAPLVVQIDDEQQLTFYPGSSGIVYEAWSKRRDVLLDAVRDGVGAVIAGGYREEVRLTSDGQLGAGEARLAQPDGEPLRIRYSSGALVHGAWEKRDYMPYAGA